MQTPATLRPATPRAAGEHTYFSMSHNDITFGKPIVKIIGSNCQGTPISVAQPRAEPLKADRVRSIKTVVPFMHSHLKMVQTRGWRTTDQELVVTARARRIRA
ncbi:hypothetical protein SJ05684_c27330 [Sinorhizobium sojae CCBAU 05684]|uniref:Uncharacterized protein n=1 Tax=Sinorhizobium sojae CCBAU 05684 TaxID=716928 RepID=A0A249PER1_9HYPH|nr:hypothetical protein SJ05684_c27330 [Sinorhizobium sojae CCBAU 05684]